MWVFFLFHFYKVLLHNHLLLVKFSRLNVHRIKQNIVYKTDLTFGCQLKHCLNFSPFHTVYIIIHVQFLTFEHVSSSCDLTKQNLQNEPSHKKVS